MREETKSKHQNKNNRKRFINIKLTNMYTTQYSVMVNQTFSSVLT